MGVYDDTKLPCGCHGNPSILPSPLLALPLTGAADPEVLSQKQETLLPSTYKGRAHTQDIQELAPSLMVGVVQSGPLPKESICNCFRCVYVCPGQVRPGSSHLSTLPENTKEDSREREEVQGRERGRKGGREEGSGEMEGGRDGGREGVQGEEERVRGREGGREGGSGEMEGEREWRDGGREEGRECKGRRKG